jgi:hypothetical protein
MAFFIGLSTALAQDVQVVVDPAEPLFNESFNITFKIKMKVNEEPYVSFNPNGLEILGKRNSGVSISTTIVNGKISTVRETQVVYEAVASRAGSYTLKDIEVEVGDSKVKVPNKRISVLKKAKEAKKLFARLELSKNKVFLGEGVNARYYLYSRVQAAVQDIKSFPKLNGFVKRFKQINQDHPETVELGGVLYQRRLIYDARIFPEKSGKIKVDPIKVLVNYIDTNRRRGGYGGWGFQFQQQKSRTLVTPLEYLEVEPVPLDNAPKSFTGLVGKHQFSLEVPREKFLVNEAIDFKLSVTGLGALENYGAPGIIEHTNLEPFDTKSDFTELDSRQARKIFDYTYIARGPVDLAQKELKMSYFDPDTKEFVEEVIRIPSFVVSGVAQSGASDNSSSEAVEESKPSRPEVSRPVAPAKPKELHLVAPVFNKFNMMASANWIKYLCFALFALIAFIILEWVFSKESKPSDGTVDDLINRISKDGLKYQYVYELITRLPHKEKESLESIVKSSPLKPETINYFIQLISQVEKGSYSNLQSNIDFNFQKKHFNEFKRVLLQ